MSEPLFFQSGVTGLSDVGYRFFDTAGDWVGSRITASVFETDAAKGTYGVAAATIPPTAKGVHWNSAGTPAVEGDEIFDTVGFATLGGLLAGNGAYAITVTVTDGTDPLQNVTVRVQDGAIGQTRLTDADGQASFSLDAGTYTVSLTKGGYTFTPVTRTVTGQETGTLVNDLEMTAIVIVPPSDPTICLLYGYFLYPSGAVAANVPVEATLHVHDPASTGSIIVGATVSGLTDADGYLGLEVIRTDEYTPAATYTITCAAAALKIKNVSLTNGTQDINALI